MNQDQPESSLPCYPLLKEIELAMLPIGHQLPIVKSMLKWAEAALERRKEHPSFGWMLNVDGNWAIENRYDHLISLSKAVFELSHPLKAIMPRLSELRLHRPLQSALSSMHDSYQKLPTIDCALSRLTLGENLLENLDLVQSLLTYTEQVAKIQEKAFFLKQIVIQEVVGHISTLYPKPRLQ